MDKFYASYLHEDEVISRLAQDEGKVRYGPVFSAQVAKGEAINNLWNLRISLRTTLSLQTYREN